MGKGPALDRMFIEAISREENQNAKAQNGEEFAVFEEQKKYQYNWGVVSEEKLGESEFGGLGSCQIL